MSTYFTTLTYQRMYLLCDMRKEFGVYPEERKYHTFFYDDRLEKPKEEEEININADLYYMFMQLKEERGDYE